MDKISDFFKELKERASNPLFFSFVISWLIFNWQIVVGLFLYKNQELKLDGYDSYIDLISKSSNNLSLIWKPLLVALAYTFAFPFFRNCIFAFNSWIKAWGTNWNLNLSKTSKISITKYIQLREIYQKRTELLQDVLEKESSWLKENEEQKNKVLELTNSKNSIFQELEKWKSINNINQLSGDWEIHYTSSKQEIIYRIRIRDNVIEYVDTPPPDKNGNTTIRSFFRNPDYTFLTFTTEFVDENRNNSYHFFYLNILNDMKLLRGTEDGTIKIEFKRSL